MKQNTESIHGFNKASLSLNLFEVIQSRSWVVLVGEEGVYEIGLSENRVLRNGLGEICVFGFRLGFEF